MRLRVTATDYSPEELDRAVPFELKLTRQLPGPDRQDYWLFELIVPITLMVRGRQFDVTHFIVAARWQGMQIEPNVENIPVNLAAVIDSSQIGDPSVDFSKCEFIAIGIASEVGGGKEPQPLRSILAGNIGAFFGKGTRERERSGGWVTLSLG